MMDIRVSAPGKAVLAGEYVVLAGAPAISMALDRRARIRVEEIAGPVHRVSAPGYLEDSYQFRVTDEGRIMWLDELPRADSFALLECVWKQAGITNTSGLCLTLDTTEFLESDSGSNLGIGSSAAVATALAAALAEMWPDSGDIDQLAAKSHREFQRGAGSGVDIATAVHGGVIQYRIGQPVLSLQWPKNLLYRLFWSGETASTTDKLGRLAGQPSMASHDALFALAREAAIAWKSGDIGRLLSTLRKYTHALKNFSIDHELGIFEAGHQELADAAESHANIVYKPCGAGGGDIGIVLATAQQDLDRFTVEAVRLGFTPLDIALDADGVRVRANACAD